MLLQHLDNDTVALKTATTTVQIKSDGSMRVGDRQVEGPGEYDISKVGIHAFSKAAVLFTEGIRLMAVWNPDGLVIDDDEMNSDVYLFFGGDSRSIDSLIKEQDPRLVFLRDRTVAAEFAQKDGITIPEESSYKLSVNNLPAEDRAFILVI